MLPFHVIRRLEKTFNFINSKCQPDLPSPITKSCHSETHPDVSRDAQGWKLQHFPAQSISMFASGKVQTGYWEQILHRAVVGYWNRLPKGSDSTEPAGDQEVFEQHSQKYSFILRWSCVEPGAELNDPVHSTVHCALLKTQDIQWFDDFRSPWAQLETISLCLSSYYLRRETDNHLTAIFFQVVV